MFRIEPYAGTGGTMQRYHPTVTCRSSPRQCPRVYDGDGPHSSQACDTIWSRPLGVQLVIVWGPFSFAIQRAHRLAGAVGMRSAGKPEGL